MYCELTRQDTPVKICSLLGLTFHCVPSTSLKDDALYCLHISCNVNICQDVNTNV